MRAHAKPINPFDGVSISEAMANAMNSIQTRWLEIRVCPRKVSNVLTGLANVCKTVTMPNTLTNAEANSHFGPRSISVISGAVAKVPNPNGQINVPSAEIILVIARLVRW